LKNGWRNPRPDRRPHQRLPCRWNDPLRNPYHRQTSATSSHLPHHRLRLRARARRRLPRNPRRLQPPRPPPPPPPPRLPPPTAPAAATAAPGAAAAMPAQGAALPPFVPPVRMTGPTGSPFPSPMEIIKVAGIQRGIPIINALQALSKDSKGDPKLALEQAQTL